MGFRLESRSACLTPASLAVRQRSGDPALQGDTEGVGCLLPGEKAQGGPHHSLPVLQGCSEEDGGSLLTRSPMEKARGNGYKLHWERFCLHRSKQLSAVCIHHGSTTALQRLEFGSIRCYEPFRAQQ